jgi:hypothetical protein
MMERTINTFEHHKMPFSELFLNNQIPKEYKHRMERIIPTFLAY